VKPFLIVFAVATAVSYLATPVVRWLAARSGAVDIPNDRKVHSEPTPTMGGVAMYIALLAALATAWVLPDFRQLFRESSEPLAILGGATVLMIVGVIDDVRGMRAPTKLAGQLLGAGVLVIGGVQIFYFWLPSVGVISLSTELSALITVIWTIAVINSVNLIDGLDGLASGVIAIAAAAFFAYAYHTTSDAVTTAELITAIIAGLCIGFLPHNFNPARIFMGDAGSMILGLLLSSATVSGISRTTEPKFIDVAGFVIPVLLPIFVLAIPLADAGLAILRRVRGRRPVFHPDKQHIHHWLLDMARSHRQAVLVMYLWSAMLAAAALSLALGPGVVWRVVAAVIGTALGASIIVLPRLLRRSARPALVAVPTTDGEAAQGGR
jgi:UDP-GlcNAc:undecaprenyl-phosphate/decaprenyl-phosphate GlcNAc-1-phosphate transferase